MTEFDKNATALDPVQPKLRLLPGIVLGVLLAFIRYLVPVLFESDMALAGSLMGGMFLGLLILLWWVFFSRAVRAERFSAGILSLIVLTGTYLLMDPSIATGMMKMMYFMFAIPAMSLAFVVWSLCAGKMPKTIRRLSMVVVMVLSGAGWLAARSDGIDGQVGALLRWRWTPTAEEKLLAQGEIQPIENPVQPAEKISGSWPGFRGAARDGIVRGSTINTDWTAAPPVELWRKPIGPACSSAAVSGSKLVTQEQRGEEEMVTCYDVSTGNPIWKHSDNNRFYDSHAGAGARSTPAIHDGRVYSMGPTGIVNVLDLETGKLIWTVNAYEGDPEKINDWALCASPLVIDNLVLTAAEGTLIAFRKDNGELLWKGPDGDLGYSSPHLLTIDGIKQILLMSRKHIISVKPESGTILWKHDIAGGARTTQPAITENGDLLLSLGEGRGVQRLAIKKSESGWTLNEVWQTRALRPNFNDYVIHKNHAYGYTGRTLVCINLENGQRTWVGGKFGGQQLLLADQDLLIIITEKGELALVKAVPDAFNELARIPAITGKTWNHPIMIDNVIIVRNGEEMAAFRLPKKTDLY